MRVQQEQEHDQYTREETHMEPDGMDQTGTYWNTEDEEILHEPGSPGCHTHPSSFRKRRGRGGPDWRKVGHSPPTGSQLPLVTTSSEPGALTQSIILVFGSTGDQAIVATSSTGSMLRHVEAVCSCMLRLFVHDVPIIYTDSMSVAYRYSRVFNHVL